MQKAAIISDKNAATPSVIFWLFQPPLVSIWKRSRSSFCHSTIDLSHRESMSRRDGCVAAAAVVVGSYMQINNACSTLGKMFINGTLFQAQIDCTRMLTDTVGKLSSTETT